MTRDGDVPAAVCAELRRAAKRGEDYGVLAEAYRLPYGIVVRHVRGRCDHEITEPPAPLE